MSITLLAKTGEYTRFCIESQIEVILRICDLIVRVLGYRRIATGFNLYGLVHTYARGINPFHGE